MSDSLSLRVADADREQLAQELREHMLAGRLSATEFEERLERAYKASTRGEIEALKEDLPMQSREPGAGAHETSQRSCAGASLRRRAALWGSRRYASVIWLASGAEGSFWPGYADRLQPASAAA